MTGAPDRNQLAADLRLAVGRLNRKLRIHASAGLTPSQSSVLATLAARGPLHLGELAEREGISAPTASKAVERLVEIGLIDRAIDSDDARKHVLTLSALGRQTAERTDDDATRLLADALAHRSPSECEAVQAALPALREIIVYLHACSQGSEQPQPH